MNKALMSRVRKLEAGHWPDNETVIVNNPFWHFRDMSESDREELKALVRHVAANPKGCLIYIGYPGENDPLVELLGEDEAREINSRHRSIGLRRSYGNA